MFLFVKWEVLVIDIRATFGSTHSFEYGCLSGFCLLFGLPGLVA